jgi:hypothetical protein
MEPHEIEEEAKKMLEKLRAVFVLAGIEVKSFHRLNNGYCGDLCCPHRPWALAETKYGLIKIGWRKQVINIEWSEDVKVHGKTVKTETEAWITDWGNGVHAYGWAKAVEYLTNFVELLKRKKNESERAVQNSSNEVSSAS